MKALMLLLLVAAPLVADAQFTFTTNNGTLAIKDYTGLGGAVVIPATTNGLPITSIGINAFLNSYGLTSITMGTNVGSIESYAFYNCTNLGNVTIPNSVTNIGSQAFLGCTGLTNATIGTNVTTIGQSAFTGTKILSVTIPNRVTSLGDYAFSGCRSLTNLVIGTNVPNIPDYAFSGCSNLTRLTIPNSVTNIGYLSFSSCLSVTNLIIGNKVISIGTNAFSGCDGLRSVIIPTNVIILADEAFAGCGGLTNISLGNVASIGIGEFINCTSLTNIGIPRSITNIGYGAFNDCDNLTAITVDILNPAYSSFGGVLFNKKQTTLIQCPKGIKSFNIPDGVTNIADAAFINCYYLRSVTIPASVIRIENNAFLWCYVLATVYCQGNAPSLGSSAFQGDGNTTVYYFGTRTGWGATYGGCPAVMLDPSTGSLQVTIAPATAIAGGQWHVDGGVVQPSGAIVTGLSAGTHTVTFDPREGWGMPASQTVTITANSIAPATGTYSQLTYTTNNNAITITHWGPAPVGSTMILPAKINGYRVTTIADYAFFGTSLTSVTIPGTVTNIGNEVFTWCNSLTTITVDPTNAFYSSSNGVLFNKDQTVLVQYPGGVGGSYTIPQSVTSIGDYAFEACILTGVTIPNNVTNIGSVAFYECNNLANVMIGPNVSNIGGRAFQSCNNLTGIYFHGNAPGVNLDSFGSDNNATVYYLPGTMGWDTMFTGIPAVLWNPQATTFIADGNQFGFNITGPTNATIVVEACADLANPVWLPVSTNTLSNNGTSFFNDPEWTNYPARFYRLRSP